MFLQIFVKLLYNIIEHNYYMQMQLLINLCTKIHVGDGNNLKREKKLLKKVQRYMYF